jgi:hypothetical protein
MASTAIATANVTTLGSVAYASTGNSAVTYMTLCNHTSGNVTANVYVVPNGETPDSTNIIIANLPLAGYDTYQLYQAAEKILLSNGDSIQVSANANSAITSVTTYTGI